MQDIGRVCKRSGYTTCIEEHGDGVVTVLCVCLLNVELAVLGAYLVSLVEDNIVHLLGLVEEVVVCVCLYWLILREELARTYI